MRNQQDAHQQMQQAHEQHETGADKAINDYACICAKSAQLPLVSVHVQGGGKGCCDDVSWKDCAGAAARRAQDSAACRFDRILIHDLSTRLYQHEPDALQRPGENLVAVP